MDLYDVTISGLCMVLGGLLVATCPLWFAVVVGLIVCGVGYLLTRVRN